MAEPSAAATRSLSPESARPRRRKIVPRCDRGAHMETARSSATCAVDLIGRTGTHAGRNGHGAPTSHGRSVWLFSNRVACLTPGTQANDLEHARRLGATECSFWCAVDGHAGQLPRRAYRRLRARSPGACRSLSVMWSVVGRSPAGRDRSQPALNGRAHALTACVPPFRVVCDASDQDRRSG